MKKFLAVFLAVLLTSFISAAYADGETPDSHKHCVCGVSDCTENHTEKEIAWQAWNGDTSVGTTADTSVTALYLYLENDVTITDTLEITNVTVHLCLNGNTLTINKDGNPAVRVCENQKFVLCDCKKTGKITGTNGTVTANVDGDKTPYFGAVNCRPGSNFVMYGGSISGNKTTTANGGGIYVSGGTFTIYGGAVNDNQISKLGSGGAVSVENGAIYTYGGEMCGNSATNGGAIHLKGSTVADIQNIKVNGNTATNMGGAIFTETSKNIKITGAELGDNTAAKGGGMYVKYSVDITHLNIYNSNIHDNNALNGHGGGMYFDGNGKTNTSANMYGCELYRNTSASDGGGIYAYSYNREELSVLNVNIFSGDFIGNSCAGGGGAIRVAGSDVCFGIHSYENKTLHIKENQANFGGGISVSADAFLITGQSLIEDNIAAVSGGGIYIGGSYYNSLILTNITVTKNIAQQGGGIYLNNNITNYTKALEIGSGTTIIGNTSSTNGTANNLYLNSGKKFVFRNGIGSNDRIGISLSETPTLKTPVEVEIKRALQASSHADGDHSSLIIPDNDDYAVVYEDNAHLIVPGYTVIFDPNNGEPPQKIRVRVGDSFDVAKIPQPVRDDCELDAWYVNGAAYNFDKPINSSLTLTARWISYTETALQVRSDSVVVTGLDKPAALYVASYDGNRLLDIKKTELTGNEKVFMSIDEIGINTSNATRIAAFLWGTPSGGTTDDGTAYVRPLCDNAAAEL